MHMEDLYRLLRNGHVEAQGIVDTVPDPLLVLDESLCVRSVSRSFLERFKVEPDETIGHPLYTLGNGQWDIPELRRLLLDVIPKAVALIDYEVEHEFPQIGRRTMLLTARTLHHPDRTSRSMLLSVVDVTERREREAAKNMLFGELRHRVKNLLVVMQSIARQTPTEGLSAQEYRDAVLGRFSALAEAQDMALLDSGKATLAKVLERILAPYLASPDVVSITSDETVLLGSRVIMNLSLVLHELATNAVKYGALSVQGGRVEVGWEVDHKDGLIKIRWREKRGPRVIPPEKAGYGTELIQSVTSYSLGGKVDQKYDPKGLQADIVIPLNVADQID